MYPPFVLHKNFQRENLHKENKKDETKLNDLFTRIIADQNIVRDRKYQQRWSKKFKWKNYDLISDIFHRDFSKSVEIELFDFVTIKFSIYISYF